MLSTRVLVKEGLLSDTLIDQQTKLRQLMRELESTQRRILMAHQVKEGLEAKRAIQATQGGVKGRVGDAVANLTMFTKEAVDDVREIKYKLENTQAELLERDKKTRKQDAQLKDIKGELATAERKMESFDQKNAVLRAQCEANNITDFRQQEMNLQRGIAEKEAKMKRLIHQLQTDNQSKDKMIDLEVKKVLQKSRRNQNLLQKIGAGLYSVKGRNQVVLIEMTDIDTFMATFRPQKALSSESQSIELSQFIGHL